MNAINLTVFATVYLNDLVKKGHISDNALTSAKADMASVIEAFIPELKTHVKNYKDTLKPAKKKPTSITCDKNDAIVADIVKAANSPIIEENAKIKRVYRKKKQEEPTTTIIVLKDELAEELYVE
jgi:hypothetical protein